MQIIQEYYGNNKSSYEISRELGIPARTIQNFLAKDTHKGWHLENEEIIDRYFSGLHKSNTPCPTPDNQIGIWPPFKSEEEDKKLFGKAKHLENIEKAKKFYDVSRGALVSGNKFIRMPSQYLQEDVSEDDAEVLDTFVKCMENLDKNVENCVLNQHGFPIPEDQWESLGFSVKKGDVPVVDNSRILLISDLHVPYHHKDAIKFLQHLKEKYNPTRVICLGDEVDHLALSYHEKETEAPSAFDELKLALPIIKQIEEMFPVMDILDSNHGSLAYRKAKTAGIPKHYLKSYADVLQVGEGWKWHFDMVIDLPTGQKCYLHHGKSSNITKTSQAMSMCSVAGHYHNTFKIEYWANPLGLYWGMQAGCLIDDKSFAFNYNNVNLHRPLIGTGLIIDGLPVLEPMVLDSQGNWIGK